MTYSFDSLEAGSGFCDGDINLRGGGRKKECGSEKLNIKRGVNTTPPPACEYLRIREREKEGKEIKRKKKRRKYTKIE